ncbi:MAG: DUF488 domain-containing protein [Pseudomonadota bacterium]
MSIVYTIGYEGTDIERFIRSLKLVGIKRLADVRAVPISRKKGFSKNKLRERLEMEGIEYVHLSSLGDPKPGREAAKRGDYALFEEIYGAHIQTIEAQEELDELRGQVATDPTCLLCFEREARYCHRSIVADHLVATGDLQILNLYGDDPDCYVRNASRMPSFHPRESAAAA